MGVLFAILAACCWGVAGVITRQALRYMSTSQGVLVSLVSSFLFATLVAVVAAWDDLPNVTVSMVLWFGLAGVLNFTIGRLLNYSAMRHLGVTRSSPIIASSPLFGALLAIIFLGERPSALVAVGTVAVFGGILLIITDRK
ncbi:MAG: DMT family transporter [Chloroflexi bacterium]|nr:DMT family transporter [Chloroflexota bacterium]